MCSCFQNQFVPQYLPPTNEVRGKVIFSEACVKNSVHGGGGGWSGPGGWAWSRAGCLLPGGGVWSRGGPAPGGRGGLVPGGCLLRGGACSGGAPGGDPPRWLLLRVVRILLECILVGMCIRTQMDKAYNFITNHSFSEILQNTTVHIRHNNVITEILKQGGGGDSETLRLVILLRIPSNVKTNNMDIYRIFFSALLF